MLDTIRIEPQTLEKYQQHEEATRAALRGVKNGRGYALDAIGARSIVAALRAYWTAVDAGVMAKTDNHVFIQRVAMFEDSLTQKWKEEAVEPPLPKLWTDPVSGAPLGNAWLEQGNMAARTLLLQVDPKLATHFQRMARDPYAYVAELRAAALRRKALAGVEYNGAIHKTSPYVLGDDEKAKRDVEHRR